MTYQEIKDRLTKCEVTLEKLKDGSYTGNDIAEKTQKLELIKESLQNQLAEAEKGMVATDDEDKAADLANKGVNVKLTSEMKPGSEEAGEHERFKRLSAKDQETINKIRAMMQAEKGKQHKVNIDRSKQTTVRKDDMDEVVDPSITQILVDFVALLGMGYGALEAVKKLGDEHGEISVDSIMKALKNKKADVDENEDEDDIPAIDRMYNSDDWVQAQKDMQENEAEDTEGGDLDVGHQDDEPDMLKQYAYDIATYAAKLYKQLDKYDKMDGEVDFPNWWQSKVILAKDYISKAQHYLEFEEKQPAIDALALEGKVNERLRFLSPEKQKANDAKFEKRMALLKALEKGIELHKAGKISDEELHNLKLKAGTISADSKFDKRKDEINEGQAQIKKKLDKINQALQQHKDKTIAISKTPADQRSEEDKAHLAKMVDLTKMKKQLMAQYDDAVSGMGAGQELDANISERVGGADDIIELIKTRAMNATGDEQAEVIEVTEFMARHYFGNNIRTFLKAFTAEVGIDDINEAKGGKFVVRPCSAKNTPWAVWQTSADGENDKRIKGFKTKPEAQKFADEKNAAK